ncbi:hypothetical protein NDU88_005469 [Pleurodeles waltl]|uniref:Uncharacterized protein n=1 Tax=Pleurodeles waltl TaxID=8319 RepID=A0AAV7PMR4_PLEWA|nr:hypothetical protein NDU88_005469 [Pleurodeles waltl]
MAAAPIWERRVLRGGRALRGAAPLELLFMPGNDRAVIPGALDHSRAQDFDLVNYSLWSLYAESAKLCSPCVLPRWQREGDSTAMCGWDGAACGARTLSATEAGPGDAVLPLEFDSLHAAVLVAFLLDWVTRAGLLVLLKRFFAFKRFYVMHCMFCPCLGWCLGWYVS